MYICIYIYIYIGRASAHLDREDEVVLLAIHHASPCEFTGDAYTYMYICTCICICMYMNMYMYIYIYVYIYAAHTHTHTYGATYVSKLSVQHPVYAYMSV